MLIKDNHFIELIKASNLDALIIGVDSSIGNAIYQRLAAIGQHVIGTSRRKNQKHLFFDLAEDQKVSDLPFARHVFVCAGINGFKACEENIELATKVNYVRACQIAKYFMMKGSHVIFFSSSSVFGSNNLFPSENAIASPNTDYGKLKALAEQQMSYDAQFSEVGKLTIIRLTKVLDSLAPLIDVWSNKSRLGTSIEAFVDLFLCPVSMELIVDSIFKICKKGFGGIIHLSGKQIMSYYDFAKILQVNGMLDNSPIIGTCCGGISERHISQCISLGMDTSKMLLMIEPEILEGYNIKKIFNHF